MTAAKGALIMPAMKCWRSTASCSLSIQRGDIEAEHCNRHDATTDEPGDVAEEGQEWQRHDQGQHPGQYQRIHRIDTESAHGVDLLAHLHRPDLGGEGEPERPATMIAVSRMPTSRSARIATMLTAKGSAPKGFS